METLPTTLTDNPPRPLYVTPLDAIDALENDDKKVESIIVINYDDIPWTSDLLTSLANAVANSRTLRSIEFTAPFNLMDEDCKALGEALQKNKSVRSVDLASAACDTLGAQALGRALELSETIVSLNLSRTEFGDAGAIAIARGVEQSRTLRELNVSSCEILDGGMVALGRALKTNRTLEVLDLARNIIAKSGAKSLGEGIATSPSLRTLGLKKIRYLPDHVADVFRGVQRSASLVSLDLSSNALGDPGATSFAELAMEHCKTLQNVDLSSCAITGKGATAIAQRLGGGIKKLNLSGNAISDEGTQALGGAMRASPRVIVELNLSNCNISNAGAEALAAGLRQCPTLASLNLSRNNIRNAGVKALGSAIGDHVGMKHFNLSQNLVTAAGMTTFGNYVASSPTLERLVLVECNVDDAAATSIGEAMERIETLKEVCLERNDIGPRGARAVARAISQSSSMMTLKLDNNRRVGAEVAIEMLGVIERSSTMRNISMPMCQLDASVIPAVVSCIKNTRSLIDCNLGFNDMQSDTPGMSEVWRALADNFKMQSLSLGESRSIWVPIMNRVRRRRFFRFILQTSRNTPFVIKCEPCLVTLFCDYFEYMVIERYDEE